MIMSIRELRKLVLFAAAAAALALSACGGDDEPAQQTSPQADAPETTPPADTTDVNPETETLPNDGDGNGLETTTEPESQTGGAGDEVPAGAMALFTGEDGRISPRVVRVPAYISIIVQLRSADGAKYGLTIGGKTITVSPELSSKGTRLDGLRPGAELVGKSTTGPGDVRISATAEPGP
jgi:hypothetical protein